MARARIVTDSTAELDPELAEELQVTVVPVDIHLRAQWVPDRPEYRTAAFHDELAKGRTMLTVRAPSAAAFRAAYTRLMRETDEIISIHVGGLPTDTVRPAREAAGTLLGRARIEVLDSTFISWGTGLIVQEAARAAQAGADAAELVRLVRGMVPRTYLALFVDNVTYLKRSGAAKEAPAMAPSPAKPLFIMEEGGIVPQFRVRSKGSALERLVDFAAEFVALQELVILHSGLMPEVDGLRQQIAERLGRTDVPQHLYGAATAAAIGPKALGLVAMER